MRAFPVIALLCAVFLTGCAALAAEPAFVEPKRSVPLRIDFANTYDVEHIRIIETVWLEPYLVEASGGLEAIRARLDQIGPKSEVAGRRFDGLTSWGVRWGFNFNHGSASCSLRNATIELEAVITLPELDSPSALSPDEAALWQTYSAQLRTHEDGHVNIYRVAVRELADEFALLGEMPDCNQLRARLAELGNAVIDRISHADRGFDASTGHGAVFPAKE